MKRFISLFAGVILFSVAIFDVGKESREALGLGPVVILLAFGLGIWLLLSKLTSQPNVKKVSLPINAALWSHSIFEGALAATSFGFGLRAGLIVVSVLLVHTLPESLAVITVLKQTGFSTRYAVKTYLIAIGLLIASFALFISLPTVSQSVLTTLATIVGGGFVYLAVSSLRKIYSFN